MSSINNYNEFQYNFCIVDFNFFDEKKMMK